MKLSWYGTASVMLESDGYRLLFDPFLGIPIQDSLCRRKLRAVKLRTADAVLVTHGHFDHILDIPRLYKGSDIKVYATKTPCRTLIAHGLPKENLTLIQQDRALVSASRQAWIDRFHALCLKYYTEE